MSAATSTPRKRKLIACISELSTAIAEYEKQLRLMRQRLERLIAELNEEER